MTLYSLITDLHLFGPYARKDSIEKTKNTILLGDIVEGANCKKSDVPRVEEKIRLLTLLFGDKYIYGNHEREGIKNNHYIENGIYFTHGDLESNYDKWMEYRFKKKGAGWFKRNIWSKIVNEFDELEREPKTNFLIEASHAAKIHGCHTYVCGHLHPKKLIDVTYGGVRIVIVPRGHTLINL